jgi:tmRNA-binding protein
MSTISPQARTNLELIIREVDVLCKGIRLPKKKSRRGRRPTYSDKYILKLVVIQYLLGFTSERSYLRFVPELKCPEFEYLPDQSQYNRRAKRLKTLTEKLTLRINEIIRIDKSKVRILDTTPVPLLKMSRVRSRKIFTDKRQMAIGYCAAQQTHYFGLKLNLFINKEGVPFLHELKPANKSDIRCLEEILVDNQRPSDIVLVADKGYVSDFDKLWFKQCWRIALITPYRRNQKRQNTKRERKLLKNRKIVETVIGQLKDQMGLEKLRAKTYQGVKSRIDNIIFTYLFGVYINKLYKRNPLNLKSLLM